MQKALKVKIHLPEKQELLSKADFKGTADSSVSKHQQYNDCTSWHGSNIKLS